MKSSSVIHYFSAPRLKSLGVVGLMGLFAGVVVGLAQMVRPYPFTTTADNLPYYAPLIKAHTDCLLEHGHLLRMIWNLGAGWSPWESGQVGFLYPPYHLANLLARLIHRPLAILETSAWLHLFFAGLLTWKLLPPRFGHRERILAGLAAITLPGPFILGANWHSYLACHPWFLTMALLSWRESESERQYWRPSITMTMASLAFFLSAHPSMYVFGVFLLLLWTLSYSEWNTARLGLLRISLAQIPSAIPLIYLKVVSSEANPNWMLGRGDPDFILMHAQHVKTWLYGTIVGNLVPGGGFRVWANANWTGVGMFFAPSLLLVLFLTVKRRDFRPLAFFLFLGALLAIGSFPWLKVIAIGPFAGFRWTWKLSIFFCGFSLISLLREDGFSRLPSMRQAGLLLALTVLGAAVCLRGLAFDLLPSLQGTHALGAQAILSESKRCYEEAGIPPGSRLAMIGAFDMLQPLPVPMLGLIGNAPLMYQQGSESLYEPMEPASAARAHYWLTVPWRAAIPTDGFHAKLEASLDLLRTGGVQALVTADPRVLIPVGNVHCFTDSLGRKTYVARLPEALPFSYPWGWSQDKRVPLDQTPEGRLRTITPSAAPPFLDTPRPVSWKQMPDGRWEGTPDGPGWGWIVFTLVGVGIAISLLDRSRS